MVMIKVMYKKILFILMVSFLLLSSSSFYGHGKPPPTKPDLIVESIELTPDPALISQIVTVEIVVGNIGTDMGYSVNGSLRIDYDEIEVIVIPELSHNENTTFTMYWTPDSLGSHVVSFIADCFQEVVEESEGNNEMEVDVIVGGGDVDLEVYDIVVHPEIPTVDHNVSFKPCIRNLGTDDSPSCEGVFYIDGELLATVSIPSISAGGSYTGEAENWMPDALGSYNIMFWADSSEIIDEDNESNNYYNMTLEVTGEDSTPADVAITYSPGSVTEMDTVTFYATATDDSGISYIEVSVHSEPSFIYNSSICYDTTSCNLTCGPFPRGDTVFYYVQARDKSGLTYRTPTYDFTVESFYTGSLTVDISFYPEEPTDHDEIIFTATASYPYGVKVLRIINYKYNYTLREEHNATSLSVTLGPFATGTSLRYYAQAEDVDGNVMNSSVTDIVVGEVDVYNTKNASAYEPGMVFLVSDKDWRTVLSLVSVSIWKEIDDDILSSSQFEEHVHLMPEGYVKFDTVRFPVLVYHYEDDTRVDVKPIINFLNYRWSPSSVVIIGSPPSILLETLVADKPVGAGLTEDDIKIWHGGTTPVLDTLRISLLHTEEITDLGNAIQIRWNPGLDFTSSNDTFSSSSSSTGILKDDDLRGLREHFWSEINTVVISDDEYFTALQASVYASILNAPLLFKDHYIQEDVEYKRVFLVGDYSEEEIEELRDAHASIQGPYSVDEMPLRISSALAGTGTHDLIVVNPLDPWVGVDRESGVFSFKKFYYKQSLLAPFLAVAKKEIIIGAPSLRLVQVDEFIHEGIDSLYPGGTTSHLTIMASPTSIPMARPNWPSHVALSGDNVYFEVFDYNDFDIKRVNLRTGDSRIYSYSGDQFQPVVTSELTAARNVDGAIVGYRGDGELTEVIPMAHHPEVGDRLIVYHAETSPDSSNDIYLCSPRDLYSYYTHGDIDRIADTTDNECNPVISYDETWVVWQQFNSTDWDIHRQFIQKEHGEDVYFGAHSQLDRDGDQKNPSIYDQKIVYQDDRNGNWDIYVFDMDNVSYDPSEDRRLTYHSADQILPRIWGDNVVYQDYKNGNWDVYLYDLFTMVVTPIATSANPEVRPVVNDDWVVWYEQTSDGLWHIWAYNLDTRIKHKVDTTEVSHEDASLLYLQTDAKFYASKNNDGHMDYPTGRLYGLTTSDLSAYVASDIFFDDMDKNKDILTVIRGWSETDTRDSLVGFASSFWTDAVKDEFDSNPFYATYNEVQNSKSTILSYFWNYYVTIFVDHGNQALLSGLVNSHELNDAYFEHPTFLLDRACSTAGYYLIDDKQWLFSTHALRAGAMSFLGAVDLSNGHEMFDELLNMGFLDEHTIGQSFQEGKNENPTWYNDVYILFGDPTVKPRWWS